MTAGAAGWETVALEVVRGTCGQAAPCGGPGEEAGWAGPRSETPAWAGWCVRAGREAVCAGCESGSCVEGEEARHSGEMAAKRMRGSYFQWFCRKAFVISVSNNVNNLCCIQVSQWTMTVWQVSQRAQHQHPETKAKWNSAVINFIYTCPCQNVEKTYHILLFKHYFSFTLTTPDDLDLYPLTFYLVQCWKN